MTNIMTATLVPTNTVNEYQWNESNEVDFGTEWNGDVNGYVRNLLEDEDDIMENFDCIIHNLPHGAVVVGYEGRPHSIFWAETVEA